MYRKNLTTVVPSSDEGPLELGDLVVAALPDLLRHDPVDPNDDHVLVVAAVEDGLALARRVSVDPPQEVVARAPGRRRP